LIKKQEEIEYEKINKNRWGETKMKLNEKNQNAFSDFAMERKAIINDFKNKKILSYTALEKLRCLDEKIKAARRGRI
jgi:hypothetical protein